MAGLLVEAYGHRPDDRFGSLEVAAVDGGLSLAGQVAHARIIDMTWPSGPIFCICCMDSSMSSRVNEDLRSFSSSFAAWPLVDVVPGHARFEGQGCQSSDPEDPAGKSIWVETA